MLEFLKKAFRGGSSGAAAHEEPSGGGTPVDVVPSLSTLVGQHRISNVHRLRVPLDVPATLAPQVARRNDIPLQSNGGSVIVWTVESLRGLFRGQKIPPSDDALHDHPEPYVSFLLRLEAHLLDYCDRRGDPTDTEMLAIYSGLRRRPDGASQGPLHDHLWRAICLELGTRPYSEAEYTSLIRLMERWVRTLKTDVVSRQYLRRVRRLFSPTEEDDEPEE